MIVEFTLKISKEDLDLIAKWMSEAPYKEVAGFMQKVANQVQEQIPKEKRKERKPKPVGGY